MNYQPKPDTMVPQSVTTGPLPGSAKVYHHVEGTGRHRRAVPRDRA